MEREDIVHIVALIFLIYSIVLDLAILGGGIALSLSSSPLYAFPVMLPKESFYIFMFFSIGITVLISERVDRLMAAIGSFAGAAVALYYSQAMPVILGSLIIIVFGIYNLLFVIGPFKKTN